LRRCLSISPVSADLADDTGETDVLTASLIMGLSDPGIDPGVADSFHFGEFPGDDGPGQTFTDQQTTGVLNLDIPTHLQPELDKRALPTDPTHSVSGQVTLRYWNRVIDEQTSPNRDDYPFRFNVKQ